jgi:transcriptional regulator with XRE-family HTH domain
MRVGTVHVDGKKIRRLRFNKGWTQEDLARKTGCAKKTIENVEAGRPVLLYTVNCLAEVFQVLSEELILQDHSPMTALTASHTAAHPFSWRTGITQADPFFDREKEQRTIRKYLRDRQSCQIVGPRRIGKTSLLRQIEREAFHWDESFMVAYLDLQDPHCFTLAGWLELASRQFGLPVVDLDLVTFSERIDELLADGRHPVLCLDEFEELTRRRDEFNRDFFSALRSCGQKPMSIITASQARLRDLTDASDPSSPFYNIFPLLELGPFTEADAVDFVNLRRAGVAPFDAEEKKHILKLARGHPMVLQVACFHALEARENGDSLKAAMQRTEDELRGSLASW